jgi:LacI family transcriptional regulator
MSDPPISSIDVDIEKGGYEAAAMAVRMKKDPSYAGEDIILHPLHLVTRESSDLLITKDDQVHQALLFIHSNVNHKILVKDVLEHVPLSRRLLEQRFLKATGKTIYQYISELRIDHFGRLLLETDEPIGNLAARMDEPDPKSLSRRFRELKGCTPSSYRKKNLRKSRA